MAQSLISDEFQFTVVIATTLGIELAALLIKFFNRYEI